VSSCRGARGDEAHTPSPRASAACMQCIPPHPCFSSAEVFRGPQPTGDGQFLWLAVCPPSNVIFTPWTASMILAPWLVSVRSMTTPC
jgi:hypothetical protein